MTKQETIERQKQQINKSHGHLGFSGVWEFFVSADGCLYRAPLGNPLFAGYRLGARFECMPRSQGFDSYLKAQGFDELTPIPNKKLEHS